MKQPDYIELVEKEMPPKLAKRAAMRVQFSEYPMLADGTWLSGWSTPHYLYPTTREYVEQETQKRWPGVEIRWRTVPLKGKRGMDA